MRSSLCEPLVSYFQGLHSRYLLHSLRSPRLQALPLQRQRMQLDVLDKTEQLDQDGYRTLLADHFLLGCKKPDLLSGPETDT